MNTTKPQHTPGPWSNDGGIITKEYHASRIVVARIELSPIQGWLGTRHEGDEREGAIAANARLIAAAPALAEALQAAAIELQIAGERLRDPAVQQKAAQARAALAAAGL